MFFNQWDIEAAASRHHDCPNVRKGVRLLQRLMEAVNAQSDGWAYWPAPSKSCEKLVALLQTAGNLTHGTHGEISAADLNKAISPIRSMVTRQKKLQAKYGNTFEFDVAAAMAETRPAYKQPQASWRRYPDEPNNGDRAVWAYDALTEFARRTRQDTSGDLEHNKEGVLGDLLCDLMHMCDCYGLDFEKCLSNGRGHYHEEMGAYLSEDSVPGQPKDIQCAT